MLAGKTAAPTPPGGRTAPLDSASKEAIQSRLVLPMVNEAAKLLEEGVVDSTDAIDLAMVLGTGLAPFRGGLVKFADGVGIDKIVVKLEALAAKHGPRFAPAPLLRRLAEGRRMMSEFAQLDQAPTVQPVVT
jgi:3-hydroxyacyl-CoA dehydrogenase/enoyl-CoA hydratase/3-hydroxybutyryl-CoA epimerase